jgi:hypothetical protein
MIVFLVFDSYLFKELNNDIHFSQHKFLPQFYKWIKHQIFENLNQKWKNQFKHLD